MTEARVAPRGGVRGSGSTAGRLALLVVLLAAFLVGVEVLGDGIAGLGGDFTDALFRSVSHPLGALSVGVLATVLAQSSSVTTATTVALVGSGVIGFEAAVPLVMGANIGTTVTNTLAALGSINRTEEFRRAFAGATMHDFFNVLAVAVLLPLELATGFLARTAVTLSGLFGDVSTGTFQSPFKAAVDAGADAVTGPLGLVLPPPLAAAAAVLLGLTVIFAALLAVTRTMRVVIAGPAERSLNAVLGRSGLLGMAVGMAMTVAVQSSSITTALLIPLVGAGVLRLDRAYPLTLGANLGTTVTALLAALAVPQIAGLQIALVHLLFNVCGVVLFYPVPWARRLPLRLGEVAANVAAERRGVVVAYLLGVFVAVPLAGTLVFR